MGMSFSGATRFALFSTPTREYSQGEQVEYMVVSFDDEAKNAKLSLRQTEILEKLSSIVDDICSDCDNS